jgi:hypothetical protein
MTGSDRRPGERRPGAGSARLRLAANGDSFVVSIASEKVSR